MISSRLFACGVLAFGLSAQSLTFEEYTPKSTLKTPQSESPRSKFPHIDVHNHQDGVMTAAKLQLRMKNMDALNMSMMVNLNGNYGPRLKEIVENMKGKHPKRFIIFANLDFSDMDGSDYADRVAQTLEADFKAGAQGLKLFKNFGMTTRDKNGKRIPANDRVGIRLLRYARSIRHPC